MRNRTWTVLAILASLVATVSPEGALDDLSLDDDDQIFRPSPQSQHSDLVNDEEYSSSIGEGEAVHKKQKLMYRALIQALRRPETSQQLGQVLPILRSMSSPQRLALAAMLTSHDDTESVGRVATMFGSDEKGNLTSALLLPLTMDIANIFRGAAAKTPEALELRNLRLAGSSVQRRRGQFRIPVSTGHPSKRPIPLGHNRRNVEVPVEMKPPPPPTSTPPASSPSRSGKPRRPSGRKPPQRHPQPTADERNGGCELLSNNICLEVTDYPIEQITASIHRNQGAFEALLADIHSAVEERPRSYEIRRSNKNRRQDDITVNSVQEEFRSEDGYLCPTSIKYARPKRARATSGQWKYIVNTGDYTQTLRLEMCLKPMESCTYISESFRSLCSQIYNYHRLLTWDEVKGLHMDIFKVPTCCSCQVQGYSFDFPPPDPPEPPLQDEENRFPDFVDDDQTKHFDSDLEDDPHLRPPSIKQPIIPFQNNRDNFETFSSGSGNSHRTQSFSVHSQNPTRDQFTDSGSQNQFSFQEDDRGPNKNQFQFNEGSGKRVPFQPQAPKRDSSQIPPLLRPLPPRQGSFQGSGSLFQRQGINDHLVPPAGPPLPLAHESDFNSFTGNQLIRRSRNQTAHPGNREEFDLEVGETSVQRKPFPNVITSDQIRGPISRISSPPPRAPLVTPARTPAPPPARAPPTPPRAAPPLPPKPPQRPRPRPPPSPPPPAPTTTTTTKPPTTTQRILTPAITSNSSGGKRVNYNYHPIIDYFKTQQQQPGNSNLVVTGGAGGGTQDWKPIVGDISRRSSHE